MRSPSGEKEEKSPKIFPILKDAEEQLAKETGNKWRIGKLGTQGHEMQRKG